MRRFEIFHSNRMEVLLDSLAEVVSEPLPSVFDQEFILVQSKGLEQWLMQQLAAKLGIWANALFPFPNAMMRRVFQSFIHPLPKEPLFSPEVMIWRILKLLPDCIQRNGFESLSRYIANDHGELKAYQLSCKIADTLDQYTLYRPEMILDWEAGHDDHWQAQLWRSLASGCEEKHRAALRSYVIEQLNKGNFGDGSLPSRICIFGIPALPAFHLDILYALSAHVRICMFLLNPCEEYWGELASRKQELRSQIRVALGTEPQENYLEVGNALLSSMGKQGQQFLNMLLDKPEIHESSDFRDPGDNHLLACIQSDILHLQDRGRSCEKKPIQAGDRSIQVHSMHSPIREMEALYDWLLSAFEEIPGLEPRDIVVMTPQIEAYAPFISAVFSSAEEGKKQIPFSIADRNPKAESLVIQAFLKILRLCGSRLGVTEIMDLLDSLPVQKKFELKPEHMEIIQHWLDATGIRWGIDAVDRERFGVPQFQENSWRQGLDRLLLGYALPARRELLFENILPFDGMEGSDTQILGRFVEFASLLFESVRALENPRTPQQWRHSLLEILEGFLLPGEEAENEAQLIRTQIHSFSSHTALAGFDMPLGIEAVRNWLEEKLQTESWAQGFWGSGVTFCEMLPMRSIPFRVVALVGMDGSAFPRQGRPPGFNLIARDPKPGDRSVRDEDRYLFLEAFLSARDRFYISYIGQSIEDNSEIPPSALVNELLDSIEQGYIPAPPAASAQDQLLIKHPLQAFSSAYFTSDSKIFSYSQQNLAALRARTINPGARSAFLSAPIADPGTEWLAIDLDDLKKFYRQPVRFFLQQRLGIRLTENSIQTDDNEPFSLDVLDGYFLEQEMTEKLLSGEDLSNFKDSLAHRGILPPGQIGEIAVRKKMREAKQFAAKVQPFMNEGAPNACEVNLEICGFHISGRIENFRQGKILRYRCANLKAKDMLAAWIDHLAGNCMGTAARTVLIGKDGCYQFEPECDSTRTLGDLLQSYHAGLKEPLRFFPQSSHDYAAAIQRQKERDEALSAARKIWLGSSWGKALSECDDPYNRLAFQHENALSEAFEKLALAVWLPLLRNMQKI